LNYKLFLVSHTHWDREWYEPFQIFRARLVKLIDKLLNILAADPDYTYFTLDGQTILLEDYLAIRPEREEELKQHIRSGRILIGPWYVLPDEFLVSPEALVRNLAWGHRLGRELGGVMKVGYSPDPFGHIGQLPQILCGFGIDTAVLRRGLSDEPTELLWEAPDGSPVLLIYLREGYDNAAHLPQEEVAFLSAIARLKEALAPHAATQNLLLMNGTDHMEPQPWLPAAISTANRKTTDEIIQSTLLAHIQSIRGELSLEALPVVRGELRSPKRHHLLPGVLSTRMGLKQRNFACQTLLEKWAEPFSAWATLATKDEERASRWASLLRQAWRHLLENHPHDSICGCSIDEVAQEMAIRFAWCQEIGEIVAEESLKALASSVDTTTLPQGSSIPILVFNPTSGPRTDLVEVNIESPGDPKDLVLRDLRGRAIPFQILGQGERELASLDLDGEGIRKLLYAIQDGRALGMAVQKVKVELLGGVANIEVSLSDFRPPDAAMVGRHKESIETLLDEGKVARFLVRAHQKRVDLLFLGEDLPGYGYKTYALGTGKQEKTPSQTASGNQIENEFFTLEVDELTGTLTITDKKTGARFEGVNRFVSGGDRGDEYNYCPPQDDLLIDEPSQPPRITLLEKGPVRHTLEIEALYHLPTGLAPERDGRSKEIVEMPIKSRVTLSPGVRRIDIQTEVLNRACDHRLRVHSPTPFQAESAFAEGHFEVVERPLGLPTETEGWIEQPVPTRPQRTFVDVNDGKVGLMVANRGLPEYEVMSTLQGSTIALTLLRCVGWLSRDDLTTRRGHAGPALETPGAQCQGRYIFAYSLIPHAGSWQAAYGEAHAFAAPLRAIPTGVHKGVLPPEQGFIHVEPERLVISAIKMASLRDPVGEGLVVRFYNIEEKGVQGQLRLSIPFAKAMLVNLNKEEIRRLSVDEEGKIALAVRGKEIVTVEFL